MTVDDKLILYLASTNLFAARIARCVFAQANEGLRFFERGERA
jgi:hypothetical protein